MNLAEAKAIRPRIVRYDGNPCATCDGTSRYVANNRCVSCARASGMSRVLISERTAQRRALRDAAAAAGLPTYLGHDCAYGHGGERCRLSGYCVTCRKISQDKRNRTRAKRNRAKAVIMPAAPKPAAAKPMVVWAHPASLMPAANDWVSCITPPTKAMLMGRRAP